MSELRMPVRLLRTVGRLAAQHRQWYALHRREEEKAKLAARDVAPGEIWAFGDHRSLAAISEPSPDRSTSPTRTEIAA